MWCWALFLTRVSDNGFEPEGARALSEPLGKLTALQQLGLSSNFFNFVFIFARGCVAVEGAWHAWCWVLFLTRVSGNDFGPEGARALSEPLGKLTALQQLHLHGNIFNFVFIFGRGCVAVEGAWHVWCWALFLTRVSGNRFGPEGARGLSEPLGKLTALQQLHLECKILFLFLYLRGDVLLLRERGMRGVGLCFLLACQTIALGLKGRGLSRSRSAS